MKTKRTGADLAAEAREFAKERPYDKKGSLALASRLAGEADAMKPYPTMSMRAVNRLLVVRFKNAKG